MVLEIILLLCHFKPFYDDHDDDGDDDYITAVASVEQYFSRCEIEHVVGPWRR